MLIRPDQGMQAHQWAAQQQRPPATPFLQQEVSKLSKWLALDGFDEETPQSGQPQKIFYRTAGDFHPASENDSTISSTSISTMQWAATNNGGGGGYSCGQSEMSSIADEHSMNGIEQPPMAMGNHRQQYWNVNANPFRPASTFQSNGGGMRPPPQQFRPQMNSMVPNGGIPANVGFPLGQPQPFGQQFGDGFPSQNGGLLPFYPHQQIVQPNGGIPANVGFPLVGQPQPFGQQFGGGFPGQNGGLLPFYPPQQIVQPNGGFHEQFQNYSTPMDMQNRDNVWRNPDEELRKWQQYTGTGIWGDPAEKDALKEVLEPIQRWMEFSDDECLDMDQRVSKLEQAAMASKAHQNQHYAFSAGWGNLPEITSGTYGRIQPVLLTRYSSP